MIDLLATVNDYVIAAAFIVACFLAGLIVGSGIALMALRGYSQDDAPTSRRSDG